MACSPDFVQYIIDQCSGAGEIAVKKMMGARTWIIAFSVTRMAASCRMSPWRE